MKPTPRRAARPGVAAAPVRDPAATLAGLALAAAALAVFLLVDTRAESAFESPKRLAAAIAIAAASAALLLTGRRSPARPPLHALLAGGALLLFALSTLLSPRPEAAREGLRLVLLFALLVPLGASSRLDGAAPLVAVAVLAGAAANGLVSAGEALSGRSLFATETGAGRMGSGAFLGNDGWVGLAAALAGAAALAVVLSTTGRVRRRAALVLAACLAGVVLGRGLTAVAALAAGALLAAMLRARRKVLATLAALAVAALLLAALHPWTRHRAVEIARDLGAGRWGAVTSYRLAPWAAALEMARERPLLGYGPGTFEAEMIPHRLRAELAWHRRLLNPFRPGDGYGEAHSDLLQAAAEGGIPAALLLVAAAALLLKRGLQWARTRREDTETLALLVFLVAGCVATISWFPLQRSTFALPLLLAAGRLHRLTGGQ